MGVRSRIEAMFTVVHRSCAEENLRRIAAQNERVRGWQIVFLWVEVLASKSVGSQFNEGETVGINEKKSSTRLCKKPEHHAMFGLFCLWNLETLKSKHERQRKRTGDCATSARGNRRAFVVA